VTNKLTSQFKTLSNLLHTSICK